MGLVVEKKEAKRVYELFSKGILKYEKMTGRQLWLLSKYYPSVFREKV
jgi:hypothetical protein